MKTWTKQELLALFDGRVKQLTAERKGSYTSRDFDDYTSEIRAVKDLRKIIENIYD